MPDKINLTKSVVDRIKAPETGAVFYWDAELRGFGLRVGAQDRAYIAQGRVKGRTVRFTIGRHGTYTPDEARKRAKAILGDISKGINPNDGKAEDRARGITLEKLFEEFKEFKDTHKKLKPKTLYEYERMMKVCFATWQKRPVREITKDMIERKHKALGAVSAAQANLAMRFLRSLLNYATACELPNGKPLLEVNPVSVLRTKKAWFKLKPRTSYIKPTELADWWKGVAAIKNEVLRDYLRLVILTGLRRNEAERLQWANVDLKEKTLTVLDTKNGRDHTLPLSDFLFDMLTRRKQAAEQKAKDDGGEESAYVFPGTGVKGHLVEPKRQIGNVTELSGITFTVHDLRRTFASIVNGLDKTVSFFTIKRLLNHAIGGDMTGGYVQLEVEQLRPGMRAVTDFVLKAAGVKASADVVDINAEQQAQ